MKRLTLVTALAALACLTQGQERDPRFFDVLFDRDNLRMGGASLRRDSLQDTMDQISSHLNTAIDRLSDAIEEQVEASLPVRLRHNGEQSVAATAEDLGGLEAISGIFGEGIDDGLKTHFNGDVDGARVEGPRYEEPTPSEEEEEEEEEDEEEVEFTEDVDSTPTHGHRPFFPFDSFGSFARGDRRGKDLDSTIKEGEGSSSRLHVSGSTLIFTVGNMQVTSCAETRDRYTCTSRISRRGIHKTVVVTHKCCHGYVKEGAGCSKVELRSMPDTLEDIGAQDFVTLVERADMMDVLDLNVTLFVPTDEAMEEFMADLEAENELENEVGGDRSSNDVYPTLRAPVEGKTMVMAHGTDGVLYASDLRDEQVLSSLMEGSTLRINTYSTVPAAATVNCARMVSVNQHSVNGVVHSIDKVLQPVTKTLAELLKSDPRFSILYQCGDAGLDRGRQFTLFAPMDSAFRTLSSPVLEALLENDACVDAIVKNHLLPNVICTAAVQGKARTINLLEEFLMLERTEEDGLMVEDDAEVVVRDVMGTNGVMHVVDKPIMPTAAQNVMEVIRGHNLTRFLGMLEAAQMVAEVAGLRDVTVFAPSNKAIDSLPQDVLDEIMNDKDKLREVLNYHITTSPLQASDITNNHIADTRADLPLRVNLYSRSPLLAGLVRETGHRYVRLTAGCSRISTLDARACGAVVHVVERLLSPPKTSVMDHLEADEDFSIFTKMVHDTGMSETLVGEGPFTVLAPSDHVFNALPNMELEQVLHSAEVQERLVKQHIIKEHVCCAGINPNTWFFMDRKRPLDGAPVHLRRTITGRIMAGPARITHCSAPARNGLIHTVNHLLLDVNPNTGLNRTRRPMFSAPGLEILFG
ncbi:Transforming growth factor-beta-induced protein ig-h3 [Chionoecetes opilio]|uniref:Transforming growth factor-beta-induced protein ig-h3 n=1 Tax=Chionoecetes opilio TaxID=41210 RepID=A0A8J8WD64_CHIOP|nr:Transforming growth factor-beta-induced protein ig-h3 [Chionoecetes opilio]